MFHRPVNSAMQGDRLGICVTQFDPKLLERGLVCTPESLHTIHAAIISVTKISYFKGSLSTKAKFHITVGHETVMGKVMFFSLPPHLNQEEPTEGFDFGKEYSYQESYLTKDSAASEQDKEGGQHGCDLLPKQQWALLEFEKPVTCPNKCLVIGSKLDTDIHSNTCRLAFHGVLLEGAEDKNYAETFLPKLKVFKMKHKEGQVERVRAESVSGSVSSHYVCIWIHLLQVIFRRPKYVASGKWDSMEQEWTSLPVLEIQKEVREILSL